MTRAPVFPGAVCPYIKFPPLPKRFYLFIYSLIMCEKLKITTLFLILYLAGHGLMAQVLVTGQVLDHESGASIPGVNISIGTAMVGAVSDQEGRFSLSVRDSAAVLTFTSIGYVTEKKPLKEGPMTVSLQPSLLDLAQVVV